MPSKAFCPRMDYRVWSGVRTLSGLRIYGRAYMKRLCPALPSHCGRWTLFFCAGTLDPRMHQWVACTKVMVTLLLTYLHILKLVYRHFVARRLAILFRVAVASTPSSPSTEETKEENCRCCWRQASRYIFFFARSASCRHFSGVFAEWD